jgi:polar amino acid transport system substrate-binding protein
MRQFILILFILVLPNYAFALDTLRISISESVPPYSTDRDLGIGHGIEPDLIRKIYQSIDTEVDIEFTHSRNLPQRINKNESDAIVMLLRPNLVLSRILEHKVYVSDSLIEFENIAISFKSKGFVINSPKDLIDKKVAMFRGGHRLMGDAYNLAITLKKTVYKEYKGIFTLVKLLYGNRYDVIIMDKRMFNFWLEYAKSKGTLTTYDQSILLEYHSVIPSTARVLMFNKESDRNQFNTALANYKKTASYNKIIHKYTK